MFIIFAMLGKKGYPASTIPLCLKKIVKNQLNRNECCKIQTIASYGN